MDFTCVIRGFSARGWTAEKGQQLLLQPVCLVEDKQEGSQTEVLVMVQMLTDPQRKLTELLGGWVRFLLVQTISNKIQAKTDQEREWERAGAGHLHLYAEEEDSAFTVCFCLFRNSWPKVVVRNPTSDFTVDLDGESQTISLNYLYQPSETGIQFWKTNVCVF